MDPIQEKVGIELGCACARARAHVDDECGLEVCVGARTRWE
jgi:hypothetical protein